MKKIYKLISISLVICISIVALCGCSAKKDANTEALKDALNNSKDYIFREQPVAGLVGIDNPILFGNSEELILSYGKEQRNFFANIDEENNMTELFSLDSSYAIEKEMLGDNGNIYAIYRKQNISNEGMDFGDMSFAEEDTTEDITENTGVENDTVSEEMTDVSVIEEEASEEMAADTMIDISEEDAAEDIDAVDAEEGTVEEVVSEPVFMEEDDESKYLGAFTKTGHKLFEVNLNNIVSEMESDMDWLFFNSLIQINDEIVLTGAFGVIALNPLGEVTRTIPKNNLDSKIRGDLRLFHLNNGKLCTLAYYHDPFADDMNTSNYILAELNPEDFSIEKYEMFGDSYITTDLFVSPGYDGLYMVGSNLFSFDPKTLESKKVLDFIASDLNAYSFSSVYAFTKERMVGVYMDSDYMPQVGFFTKVDPKDIKEKKNITIGMFYTDYNVRKHVFAANKESLEYKYNIIDYDSLYSGSTSEKLQQISKDAAAGELPDILLVDPAFPVDIYISKHLFTDLYPFIDNDPDVDRANLLPNILDAYSVNDKLYQLVPAFSIETLITKESYVEGKDYWNIFDANDLWIKQGLDKNFMADVNRIQVLEKILTNSKDTFINWDEGVCNFNNEEFIKTLEFVKRIPEKLAEIDWANYDWTEEATQYIDGRTISQNATIYSYQSFNNNAKGDWGGDCKIIGYPSDNGNGSVIKPRIAFAISDLSPNKEGAWEFIKYFLSEEYLSTAEQDWFIPNSMSALKISEAAAQEKPFYIDYETQDKVYYEQTYYMGDTEIIIKPMTEEEATSFTDYILSVDTPYRLDANLMAIVSEEAAAYFANQKSAETVAEVIQSRVSLYLAESR